MTTSLPRFSQKDVRQFAQQLIDHGFYYRGDDTKGHAQFGHPRSARFITLPETPHGNRWRAIKWNDAQQIMGHRVDGKFDRTKAKARAARDRETFEAQASRMRRDRDTITATKDRGEQQRMLTLRIESRRSELRSIASLMGGGSRAI